MTKPPYTPELAYKKSVRPLAIFFILFGVIILVMSCVPRVHISGLPAVQNELARRIISGSVGLLNVLIGVGLYWRSRFAWYSMFAYIIIGTAVMLAAQFFGRPDSPEPPIDMTAMTALILFALNGGIAFGLYVATKPVFCNDHRK
jgi:hypothetical protein